MHTFLSGMKSFGVKVLKFIEEAQMRRVKHMIAQHQRWYRDGKP